MLSPLGIFGLFWMAAAAAWAVVLYMRSQRPAWITIGAGARIGLVTGLLGGWTACRHHAASRLFVMRFCFHPGQLLRRSLEDLVNQQMSQQWAAMGVDAQSPSR